MKYPNITLGRIEAVWNILGGEEGVQSLLSGVSEVVVLDRLIDCDACPFVPDGWSIEKHQKGGQFKWDASQVHLFLAEGQQNEKRLEGNKLRGELVGKLVLNANVLDYLLAHPRLIPQEWKCKAVFFWGTICRDSRGNLHVPSLYYNAGRWIWHSNQLNYSWLSNYFAALRAH